MNDAVKYLKFHYAQGAFKNRLLNHIQGICYGDTYTFSRNGDTHSEIFTFPYVEPEIIAESHVGGIDQCGKVIAMPYYDHYHNRTGILLKSFVRHNGLMLGNIPIETFRPYAVGIERFPNSSENYLIGVISKPDGSEILWYEYGEAQKAKCFYAMSFKENSGPRNNITLGYRNNKLFLFSQRAYFGHGVVTKYRVDIDEYKTSVDLTPVAEYKRRNGLVSCRFGSTIRYIDGQDYWVRTARNVFRQRLRIREDLIEWKEIEE